MVRFLACCAFLLSSAPAYAAWSYEASEGGHYAWSTDGGFVESSYQNGLTLFCPDLKPSDLNASDNRHRSVLCEFSVTLNGEKPEAPAIVSFRFDNGETIQRQSERVQGSQPQIALEGRLLELMLQQSRVTASVRSGAEYTFSLKGSSAALRGAMGL